MSTTFESNFSTTGSPTIKIYKVVKGTYTLVKSSTMVATPETGKYAYDYKEIDTFSDYSARMTLGSEKVDGVYNGLFSQILGQASVHGGGGGGSYKMTKPELDRIVKEMTKLFKNTLDGVEIALPDDLGIKEIVGAIKKIEKAGADSVKSITTQQQEFVKTIKGLTGKEKEEYIKIADKIDTLELSQEEAINSIKKTFIVEMKNSDKTKDIEDFSKMLNDFAEKQKTTSMGVINILGAFRNEFLK